MGKTDELAKRREEWMTAMQLVGPERAHDQDALRIQRLGDEAEQVQARGVGPVEILDNNEQRPVLGDPRQEVVHGTEQVEAIDLVRWPPAIDVAAAVRAPGPGVPSTAESGPAAPGAPCPRRRWRRISMNGANGMLADVASTQWPRTTSVLRALATPASSATSRVLPIPASPPSEHQAGLAPFGRVKAGDQPGTLLHSADEHRARDASNHAAIMVHRASRHNHHLMGLPRSPASGAVERLTGGQQPPGSGASMRGPLAVEGTSKYVTYTVAPAEPLRPRWT